MSDRILTQIQDRYQKETALLRLEQQAKENRAALRQAQFDLREAQQEQVLYSGSFRSFRDRMAGKKEETETALRHAVQKTEADLASARQTARRLELQMEELHTRLNALPDGDSLRQQAGPEALREWYRLDALYCAEALSPLLEENRDALLEQRNMMSGANVGKIYTYAEQAEIHSAPEKCGKICKSYVLRLKAALTALEIPSVPCPYFDDPTTFVNGVIAQHNRRDRLNEAIAQAEALQRLIRNLPKHLGE